MLQSRWQGFGMRAIALSVLLIVIMVFRPSGVMGRNEANWNWLLRDRLDVPSDEERRQDAWLHGGGDSEPGDAPAGDERPAHEAGEEG